VDVGEYPVSGVDVIFREVVPNLVEIRDRIGMERVAAHPPARRRSLFSRSFLNASSPSIGCTRPVLRSSKRLSSVLRTEATSSRYPASASSTMSPGARPLVVARSFSFFAVWGVTRTSMRLLYGFRQWPASHSGHLTHVVELSNLDDLIRLSSRHHAAAAL